MRRWIILPTTIAAIFIVISAFGLKPVHSALSSITTENPIYLYWPTRQASQGLQDVEHDVRMIEAGSTVDMDLLATRIDVLISAIGFMVRPSELNNAYQHLDEFRAVEPLLRDLADNVLPQLGDILSPSDASALMPRLGELKVALHELSSVAWIHDSFEKDQTLRNLRHALIGTGIAAGLLLCTTIVILALWWRYQSAIKAKTFALAGEERAIAEKVSFLGMIGHELRTPLQVIISALDLMEDPAHLNNGNVRQRVRRAVSSLSTQLRDILTVARSEVGYIELQPCPFEAIALVKDVVKDNRPSAEEKGLKLLLSCDDEAIFVSSDSERIGQILHNLLSNAIKYTVVGSVQVEVLPFDAEVAELRFRVTDTGVGLPSGILDRHADKSGRSGSGKGIGLTVVETLSAQLGARIAINTNAAGGTTFDVSVPVVSLDANAANDGDKKPKRVLIVDDQIDVRTGLASVFKGLGYEADLSQSGAMALNFLAVHTYSAVFIDLDMPVMSGLNLARQIRKIHRQGDLRLVLLSAAGDSVQHDPSLFDAILTKPVRRQQLTAIMHA